MASVRGLGVSTCFAWSMAAGFPPLRPARDDLSLFRCPVDWNEYHAATASKQGAYASDFFDLGEDRFLPAMFRESTDLTAVKTAIIVVHGADRSSGWNLNGVALGVNAVHDDAVAIVAPSFPDRPCTARKWTGNSKASGSCAPVWSRQGGWSRGYESDPYDDCPTTISSYLAMDMVIDELPLRYPNVSQIVLTGFSAGGGFAQSWSLLSPHGENGTTRQDVRLRIIAGAPPDYAYLDTSRPDPSCNERDRKGLKHTCSMFQEVEDMHWTWNGTNLTNGTCDGSWDHWPYGLSCLRPSVQNSTSRRCAQVSNYTLQGLRANGSGANASGAGLGFRHRLLHRFASKDFRVSTGMKDHYNCVEFKCSKKCPPMLQGSDRLQRGLNFVAHLNRVLAPYNYTAVFSSFDAGHDSDYFYSTNLFKSWVFGPDYKPRNNPLFFLVILLPCLAALALIVGAAVFWRRKRHEQGHVLVAGTYSVQMARICCCRRPESEAEPGAAARPAEVRASREAFLDGLGSTSAPETTVPSEDIC